MAQVILLTDIASKPIGYGKYAGTYRIATEIRNAGYTCQVIDNYTFIGSDQLKLLLKKFIKDETIAIGISCTLNEKQVGDKFYHWGIDDNEFANLMGYAKILNSKVKVIQGGSRAKNKPDWAFVDYTIIGKADKSILALLDYLTNEKDLIYTQLKNTKLIKDVDYAYTQTEFEDSTIKYEHNDIIFPGESLPIEIARGCIFKCAFCKYDLIGKRPGEWTKTAKTIRSEMIRNYELFGTTHYNISDELVNESIDKLKMVSDIVSSLPFKLEYTAYARIDLIWRYPEMRDLLLESGAISLLFGLETFHEKAGKAIGKGLDPNKVKETLNYCRDLWKNKILMTSNFIIGLPHEPKDHILSTFEYLLSDAGPLDIWTYTVLDFNFNTVKQKLKNVNGVSKIEESPEKFGLILDHDNISWSGTHMNRDEANLLLKQIESDPRYARNLYFGDIKWFGRSITLGYNVNDIFNGIRNNDFNLINRIQNKTTELKNRYVNRLLEL